MPILYTPPFAPTSARRPIEWTVGIVSGFSVERAIGRLYINGSLVTQTPVSKSPDPNLSAGVFYFFVFDFQQIVADFLLPQPSQLSSVFGTGTTDVPYNALSTDAYCEIYAEFEYYYRDTTTNTLVNAGVVDMSNDINVLVSTRQHRQPMDFADYEPFFNSDNDWLTDAPDQQEICEEDSHYLSYLVNVAAQTIKITTYDKSGAQIDTGTFTTGVAADYPIRTIGVGMANLRTQVYATGAVDIDDPDMAYYTVQLVGLFGFPYLRTLRFDKVDCCENRRIRIHFLNLYGCADAFTFDSKRKDSTAAKSARAQKPLNWNGGSATPHLIQNKGGFKIQNTAVNTYEVESRFLTKEEAQWLSQILHSPETYIETADGLVPCEIEDTEQDTHDSTRAAVAMRLKIVESNEIITITN